MTCSILDPAARNRFRFSWRPRGASRAHAAPSRLWDYYDPTVELWLRPAFYAITKPEP